MQQIQLSNNSNNQQQLLQQSNPSHRDITLSQQSQLHQSAQINP
jgi:hypothetical protein